MIPEFFCTSSIQSIDNKKKKIQCCSQISSNRRIKLISYSLRTKLDMYRKSMNHIEQIKSLETALHFKSKLRNYSYRLPFGKTEGKGMFSGIDFLFSFWFLCVFALCISWGSFVRKLLPLLKYALSLPPFPSRGSCTLLKILNPRFECSKKSPTL